MPLPKVGKFPLKRNLEVHQAIYDVSGAATTASRLGQPDLAIATLNDFVGVGQLLYHLPSC